jgi:hypothetical protein
MGAGRLNIGLPSLGVRRRFADDFLIVGSGSASPIMTKWYQEPDSLWCHALVGLDNSTSPVPRLACPQSARKRTMKDRVSIAWIVESSKRGGWRYLSGLIPHVAFMRVPCSHHYPGCVGTVGDCWLRELGPTKIHRSRVSPVNGAKTEKK